MSTISFYPSDFQRRCAGCILCLGQHDSQWLYTKLGVLPGVKHKGGQVCRGMYPVIVGELGYGLPFIPVILMLVHKESEELLDLLVNPLSLTVHLQVISGGGCHSDP